MEWSIWAWVGFNAFVLAMLALDLGVFHRTAHEIRFKEAATWSLVWVACSLLFAAGLFRFAGSGPALEFLTGYVIEKSLAVDNIFVFVMIFSFFAVPSIYQHRVLFWGILGALAMRGFFIGVGAWMLERWHWVIYVFGAFLLLTGLKLAFQKHGVADAADNALLRLVRRAIPITPTYHGDRFFVRVGARWMATPLFMVLVAVEFSDLVFAIDSIPAIFAVTTDPFLVYTSNVLAILGLRSMYFLLAGVVDRFVYLKPALAVVLVFIGAKMMLLDIYKIPTLVSLGVIALVIGGGIGLSLFVTSSSRPLVDRDGS